jgi:hypothetical protein
VWTKDGSVTGEWRRLHNEKLNDLYYSPKGGESVVGIETPNGLDDLGRFSAPV